MSLFLTELYNEFGVGFCNVESRNGVIFPDLSGYGSKEYKIIEKIKSTHGIYEHIEIAFDNTVFGSFLDGVYVTQYTIYVKPKFQELKEFSVSQLYDISYNSDKKYLEVDYETETFLASDYARRIAERLERAFNRYKSKR